MLDAMESLDGVDAERLETALGAGPLLRVICREGRPQAASLLQLVEAPADLVWAHIGEMERFPEFVNMIRSVEQLGPGNNGGELVKVNLRFKISLFSAKFDFIGEVKRGPGTRLDIDYHDGKVRDVAIQLEVAPVSEQRSVLRCFVGFDQTSLGWLVRVFIRHHPEIDWGVHAGSVLSIASSAREAAEIAWARQKQRPAS